MERREFLKIISLSPFLTSCDWLDIWRKDKMAFEVLGYYDLVSAWSPFFMQYANGYIYVLDYNNNTIKKIRASDMTLQGSYTDGVRNAPWAIDPTNNYLYALQWVSGAGIDILKKIDTTTMTLISSGNLNDYTTGYGYGALNLDDNELYTQVVLYFTTPYTEKFVKTNLTTMSSTVHTVNSDYNHYNCAAYHNGYAYFGTGSVSSSQWILKIQTSDMTKVSDLEIPWTQVPGIGEFYAGFKIDTINNFLYTCSYKDEEPWGGVICKIDLSTFSLVGYATIETDGQNVLGFSLDQTNQKIYCIDDGDYGSLDSTVYVIDCETLTVLSQLTLPNTGDPVWAAGDKGSAIDVNNGWCFFMTFGESYVGTPARIWKIGLLQLGGLYFRSSGTNAGYYTKDSTSPSLLTSKDSNGMINAGGSPSPYLDYSTATDFYRKEF